MVELQRLSPCLIKCFIRYFPLRNFRLLYYPEMRCYTTPCTLLKYSIYALLSVKWSLTSGENFKRLALNVVAVAYESWTLTRGSK